MLWTMVAAQLDFRRLSLAPYPLARAFAISLLFHALLFLTIEVGHQAGLWKTTVLFTRPRVLSQAQRARLLAEAQKKEEAEVQVPLVFVDVDPSQAATEPPKDTKYYSAVNSRAANRDTRVDTTVPKIEGHQEHVPQTMDKARPKPQALQPQPAPAPQVAETKPQPQAPPAQAKVQEQKPPAEQLKPEAKPLEHPGDLAYAKPAEKPVERIETKPVQEAEPLQPAHHHYRSLQEAALRKGGLAGEKMKQEGGVRRIDFGSLDVRSSPFGAYDALIIAAIQEHWYDLLDRQSFAGNFSGKVVLEFRLNSDGRVTDLKVNETSVPDTLALLCQRAVQEPAPFQRWPSDLRRLVGKEYRDVRFTFYYN